jgi:hypothetical protein
MIRLPVATSGQKPTIGAFKFPGDAYALLNVVADGPVHAWHEDEPITLSCADGWYLGSFAVPPDADHAEVRVEIDGVEHNLVITWPGTEPAEPVLRMPLKLRQREG